MDNILRDLLLNGFMIYQHNNKFCLKKESVPSNTIVIKETQYENYDLALEAGIKMLSAPQVIKWTATARYNRGLGIEYKNIVDIAASDELCAKNTARELFNKIFEPTTEIHEIKVYIKK